MENTKITGNEPYFPTLWDSAYNATIQSDGGVTIRQKFIMDYITNSGANSALVQTRNEDIAHEANKAFEEYLKIINEPTP